jgi:hypothetical protein
MMVTDVPLIDVTSTSDASMTRRTATTTTHVPLTAATPFLDVSTHLLMLMTRTHVQRTGAMQRLEKLNMRELFVMTRTHVPSNLAILSSDASTYKLTWTRRTKKILTNA